MKRIVLFCVIAFAAQNVTVLSQSPKPASSSAHRHGGANQSIEVDIPEFAIVETSLESDMKKDNLVTSRNRKYSAFTVSDTRLFVADRSSKKIFEIKGLPLEWRPFSDLSWADNQTLVFDRWSQPHHGVHYAVNVKSRKLVVVKPFGD